MTPHFLHWFVYPKQRHNNNHQRYPAPRNIPARIPPDEGYDQMHRNVSRSHPSNANAHSSRSGQSSRNADPRRQYQSSSGGGSRPSSSSRSSAVHHQGYDDCRGQQQNSYKTIQYTPIP